MIVERVWFHKVNDVKSIGFARFRIRDSEIVPLGMTVCAIIGLQDQVIFEFIYLNSPTHITRLEARFKD